MKCLNIIDNRHRGIKIPDQVFPVFMIDCDFSAYTAVVCKNCCRHLDEINPTHKRCSSESGNISHDTAAKGDNERLSVKSKFNGFRMQLIKGINAFGLFPCRNHMGKNSFL